MKSVFFPDGRCGAPPFLFTRCFSRAFPLPHRVWCAESRFWSLAYCLVAVGCAASLLLTVFSGNLVYAEGFPAVEVYERSAGAVVLITAHGTGAPGLAGAGTILTEKGQVVTNAHVVIDANTGDPYPVLRVFLKPERVTGDLGRDLSRGRTASVVTFDTGLDLALLQVEGTGPSRLPFLTLANPEDIRIGEEVVAIGHPEQGGLWSLTYGRISGQIPNYSGVRGKDVFQTDTSLNRGNSGGPLLDKRGYVVGINTSIARLAPDKLPITGVNFTLKSSVVREWLAVHGINLGYGIFPLGEAGGSPGDRLPPASGPGGNGMTSGRGNGGDVKGEREVGDSISQRGGAEDALLHPPAGSPGLSDQSAESKEPGLTGRGEAREEDRILTPRKPYTMDALFGEVEEEMEEMMGEMREKIHRKKNP